MSRLVLISEFFESASVWMHMKILEKADIKVHITDKNHTKILEGIIDKEKTFVDFMGQGNIFVTDDADTGALADALRKRGEKVFGGSVESDRWENERSYGQKIMKRAGTATVPSKNFKGSKAFDEAIEFVQKSPKRYVIKQNGDKAKGLSCVGKFENGDDVIDRLKDYRNIWTSDVDFELMDFVEGYEIAIEGWFNGNEWMKDSNGKEIFIMNIEFKKLSNGDRGFTTGETGTLARRVRNDSPISREIQKYTKLLQKIKYIGCIDLNCMLKKDKTFVGLEWTSRFGYPAIHYFQEMLKTPFHELLQKSVSGGNGIEVDSRWATVVVLQLPPFPFTSAQQDIDNAKGQRMFFTENGKWSGRDDLTTEKLSHFHPYEIRFDKETKRFLATGDTGYVAVVSGLGNTPKESNDNCLKWIADNFQTTNLNYRDDIGINKRAVETIEFCNKNGLI